MSSKIFNPAYKILFIFRQRLPFQCIHRLETNKSQTLFSIHEYMQLTNDDHFDFFNRGHCCQIIWFWFWHVLHNHHHRREKEKQKWIKVHTSDTILTTHFFFPAQESKLIDLLLVYDHSIFDNNSLFFFYYLSLPVVVDILLINIDRRKKKSREKSSLAVFVMYANKCKRDTNESMNSFSFSSLSHVRDDLRTWDEWIKWTINESNE